MSIAINQNHRTLFTLFGIGVAVSLFFLFVPSLHHIIEYIDSFGYAGVFLAGILYGSALTSSTAILIFVHANHGLNPILAAIIGGLGAALYDTSIFLLFRNEGSQGVLARFIARLNERRHIPKWTSLLLGSLIIASPLPDELASGLLGLTNTRVVPFMAISFAANTFGVLLLTRL